MARRPPRRRGGAARPGIEFFTIGTNDLTQYVMAADRQDPQVANLNRADHPAVLRAVDLICQGARKAGIWVGVCGEAAARPELIPKLIALGVTELSDGRRIDPARQEMRGRALAPRRGGRLANKPHLRLAEAPQSVV